MPHESKSEVKDWRHKEAGRKEHLQSRQFARRSDRAGEGGEYFERKK